MKPFLLGVAATLAVLALGLVVVLLLLGSGDPVATPSTAPSGAAPSGAAPKAPGDLGPDETWLGSVDLRSADVVSADGDLADVVASGTGVRFSPSGLRADRLHIDATVPFATVAEQVGDDVRIFPAAGGRAGIERQVTVLGRDVTVSATGTVGADGGQLLIEPETVELGGPSFLDAAASAVARGLVTIRQDVPGVPEGMALTAVAVTPQGFAASLTGADVTITR
ncbi:MAG TPA: LmeA family phospholipid-binding protein [Ornithinibacter sp.]|nr:LmeA family phospholipid-binding protein [Ornithinibacter sp.]